MRKSSAAASLLILLFGLMFVAIPANAESCSDFAPYTENLTESVSGAWGSIDFSNTSKLITVVVNDLWMVYYCISADTEVEEFGIQDGAIYDSGEYSIGHWSGNDLNHFAFFPAQLLIIPESVTTTLPSIPVVEETTTTFIAESTTLPIEETTTTDTSTVTTTTLTPTTTVASTTTIAQITATTVVATSPTILITVNSASTTSTLAPTTTLTESNLIQFVSTITIPIAQVEERPIIGSSISLPLLGTGAAFLSGIGFILLYRARSRH